MGIYFHLLVIMPKVFANRKPRLQFSCSGSKESKRQVTINQLYQRLLFALACGRSILNVNHFFPLVIKNSY